MAHFLIGVISGLVALQWAGPKGAVCFFGGSALIGFLVWADGR